MTAHGRQGGLATPVVIFSWMWDRKENRHRHTCIGIVYSSRRKTSLNFLRVYETEEFS